MDKLLTTIQSLKQDLEADWRNTLDNIGLWPSVQILYKDFTNWHANVILTFIVLAYHRESGWINLHKDRQENKDQIMLDIGGIGALQDEELEKACRGSCDTTMCVVRWLMDYQKDWRWLTIEQCFAFHSEIMHAPRSDDHKKRGQAISEAIDKRREGDKLLKEIQQEFIAVDSILEAEGLPKITDEGSGPGSWEEFLRRRKNKVM